MDDPSQPGRGTAAVDRDVRDRRLSARPAAIESRARQVLGLDDLEAVPNALAAQGRTALAPRRVRRQRAVHQCHVRPHGARAGYRACCTKPSPPWCSRHEALRTRLAVQASAGGPDRRKTGKPPPSKWSMSCRANSTDNPPGSEIGGQRIHPGPDGSLCPGRISLPRLPGRKSECDVGISGAWLFFRCLVVANAVSGNPRRLCRSEESGTASLLEPAHAISRNMRRRSGGRSIGDLASHLTYWHGKLRDMPRSRLPYDHETETGRRGRSFFFVDQDIVPRLTAISQASRVSLTLVLLAAINCRSRDGAASSKFCRPPIRRTGWTPSSRTRSGFWSPTCRSAAASTGPWDFASSSAIFAREFYGSYAHRELSCELYEAIFSPADAVLRHGVQFRAAAEEVSSTSEHAFGACFRRRSSTAPQASRPAIYREIYLGLIQYPNGISGKALLQCRPFHARRHRDLHPAFPKRGRRKSPPTRTRSCKDLLGPGISAIAG